jgi:hypothetical protein
VKLNLGGAKKKADEWRAFTDAQALPSYSQLLYMNQ